MPTERRYAFLALLTISICVLAIYIHRHRAGKTGKLDEILISMTGIVQKQFFYLIRGCRAVSDHYLFLVNTKKQNEQLEKDVGALEARVAALEEVKLENQRLKELLRFEDEVAPPLISAHVIAHDVSSDYFAIRVDKGLKSGIQVGQGVVSPKGVVGRVLRTTNHWADVLTLLDPTSNIDVVIQQSRARGILTGVSKRLSCKLKYVDRLDEINLNDTVVSSGFGEIFPKGLLVGYVSAVIPNPTGVLQTVMIKSAVDIYRLEEVFVVSTRTVQDSAAE